MEQLRQLRAAVCCALIGCYAWRATAAQQAMLEKKTPSEKAIVQLLDSDDPREVAWGAHYARIKERPATDAALLTAAERWQPLDRSSRPYLRLTPEQSDQLDGMAAVLDALIRLRVAVPAVILRGLANDFPADVAILISRLPAADAQDAEVAFFRKLAANGYALQYVSAALLAQSPPDGFAAELLAGIEVHANVYIRMPGEPETGWGISAGDCMGFGLDKRDGWPIFSSYALTFTRSEHALLVLKDPQPVYAVASDSSRYIDSSCGGPTLSAWERRKLVASMLRIKPEEIPWETGLSRTIEYRSAQQVDAELRALIEEEQRKYRITADQLVEAGLIPEQGLEESLPVLDLRCHIADNDRVKAPSPLPNRVRWEMNPQGLF